MSVAYDSGAAAAAWRELVNYVAFGAYDCADAPQAKCLVECNRTKLLLDIMGHLDRQPGNVVWLHGADGTGKTAVARFIVKKLGDDDRLAARFFFSREDNRRQSLNIVLPTIAYQLGVDHPRAKEVIVNALIRDPGLINENRPPLDHLIPLFVEPLRAMGAVWYPKVFDSNGIEVKNQVSTRVLVFDGVDQCLPHEYERTIHFFHSLLNSLLGKEMPRLHVVLTSHTAWPLQQAQGELYCGSFHTIDIHSYEAEPNISQFVKTFLTDIALQHFVSLPQAWPSEEDIKVITKGAAGRFIFSVTVALFADRNDVPERLASALQRNWTISESIIHYLYCNIIDESENESRPYTSNHLTIISCLPQPVLLQKLGRPMQAGKSLARIRDFPLSPVAIMSSSQEGPALTGLDQQHILQNGLIFWIEVMAASNKLDLVPHVLRNASEALEKSSWDASECKRVQQLLYDAERLVQEFYPALRSSVTSLRHSALPFIPRTSEFGRLVHGGVAQSEVQVMRGLMPHWGPQVLSIDVAANLPSLDPAAHALVGVAVSPDGKRLMSWHSDGHLHLWDTLSGSKTTSSSFKAPFSPRCRHRSTVHFENAITFSEDGSSILLVSRREVWLWEISRKPFGLPVRLSLSLSSDPGDGLCCAVNSYGDKGPVIVVGTTRSILVWRPSHNQSWTQAASQPTVSCTTAVSVSPCGQWILSSGCGEITVHLRRTDNLANTRELPCPSSAPCSSLLVCHFFNDGHAVVLWSSLPDHYLLSRSPTSSSPSYSGKVTEYFVPEKRSVLLSLFRRAPSTAVFDKRPPIPLYFGGRLAVIRIDNQLFTRSGLLLRAWSPNPPLENGSYVRVATISEDKRYIHLWDPSISVDSVSVVTSNTRNVARHLDVLRSRDDRLVVGTSLFGNELSNVGIVDLSCPDTGVEMPIGTETFSSVTVSHDLQSFVFSSNSPSAQAKLYYEGSKTHYDLNTPYASSPSDIGHARLASFSLNGTFVALLFLECVVIWRRAEKQVQQIAVVKGSFNAVVFSHDSASVCCVSDCAVHFQRLAPASVMLVPPKVIHSEGSTSNFVCAAFSSDVNALYTVEAVYRGSTVSNKFEILVCRHDISSEPLSKKRLKKADTFCLSIAESHPEGRALATISSDNHTIPATTGGADATRAQATTSASVRAKGNFTFSPQCSLLVLHSGNHYYQTMRLFPSNEINPFEHVPSGSIVDVESWSDFSLRSGGWIYKGSRKLCWVPPAYRPYTSDVRNIRLGKCNGFKVLGRNKVVLVRQHDFVVLHFPRVE